MTFAGFLRGSALGALAIASALTASPSLAQFTSETAAMQPERAPRERLQRGNPSSRGEARAQQRTERAQQRTERAQAPQPQRAREATRAQPTAPQAAQRSGRDWNRSDRATAPARGATATPSPRQIYRDGLRAGQRTDARQDRRDTREAYRDGRRDERRADGWQDRRQTRESYRDGYRDGRRTDWGNRTARADHRRWDNRAWRNDYRYNWSRHRAANRSIFQLGRYYSPYRNHRYSRLSIGFRLDNVFFGNRYWINDPGRYRLPPVYGDYRWVRYYDDVLLIDTWSGEVVDVIYDFFW